MTDRTLSTALTFRDIARAAGDVILDIYRSDFSTEEKSDQSPVTEADRAAEALILRELAQAFPDIPVVAEEAVSDGNIPEIGARFILVDPLDGTKEFIQRRDAFTVNIALIEHHVPVAGVVHAPALGRTFVGAAGSGAWEERNGDRHRISIRKAPACGLTAVASLSHATAETEALIGTYNVADRTSIGSSLKFCLLASGEADLYPRLGPTMEWDTAAGHAVLAAAGGHIVIKSGEPLTYGRDEENREKPFLNPWFVAFGDPEIPVKWPN